MDIIQTEIRRRKSKWHLMHIEDDGKMEYLLGPYWEIGQDG